MSSSARDYKEEPKEEEVKEEPTVVEEHQNDDGAGVPVPQEIEPGQCPPHLETEGQRWNELDGRIRDMLGPSIDEGLPESDAAPIGHHAQKWISGKFPGVWWHVQLGWAVNEEQARTRKRVRNRQARHRRNKRQKTH